MFVGASFVYLLCVCGVFVHSFVRLACWLIFLLFARLRRWFGVFVVVLLFALVVVYMCGRSAVWWLVLLVSMGLCACVLVCRVVRLRGSCVALLYKSPGGNQVDGLPPAFHCLRNLPSFIWCFFSIISDI